VVFTTLFVGGIAISTAMAGGDTFPSPFGSSAKRSWHISTATEPAVVRALQDLTFATGGTGHVVFLGRLVAGVAVPGMLAGLLPRLLALVGLVIAAVA
jgi:hypothetical protein